MYLTSLHHAVKGPAVTATNYNYFIVINKFSGKNLSPPVNLPVLHDLWDSLCDWRTASIHHNGQGLHFHAGI